MDFANVVHADFILDRQGKKMPVHVAEPETAEALPALILIHEIFGVNEHIVDLTERFAQEGLRVYAPELFASSPLFPNEPDQRNDLDTMRKVWGSIQDARLIEDLNALFLRIHQSSTVRSRAIGTIGYCMGGAIALMFACSNQEVAYIIDYYGRIKYPATNELKPKHPIEYTDSLRCPLLGLFSGIDELIPPKDIEELEKKLEEKGVPFEIKIFEDAPHAFFNDTRPNYRKEAAKIAWQMTLNFIEQYSRADAVPRAK